MPFFSREPKVSTDEAKIAELLSRGVEHIFPNAEFLEKELKSGRRLSLYLGIDPTGPTLHMGHVIPLLKLRQFQKLGHKVILLIGDFTGMIGDPTDKSAARVPLTREQVMKNAALYKEQASRLIDFKGGNAARLRHNSEWLGTLSMEDTFKILAHLTYAQTIKRDMFQKRMDEGKDLFLHEFLYPMMQGYDSVAMDVDGEIGGNDQMYNMLVGRDLMKKMKGKEKFVVTMKLLADPAGKKMGKTEGNMVAFSDAPSDAFGKVMSWPDSMILDGLELCTLMPLGDIGVWKQKLEGGANPKDAKLALAEAVVSLLHGESGAKKAQAAFESAFSEGKPKEFTEIRLAEREIGEALIVAGVVDSKSELRRLIAEGAVTNLDTNAKMGEEFLTAAPFGKYRIGKHRFVEIK